MNKITLSIESSTDNVIKESPTVEVKGKSFKKCQPLMDLIQQFHAECQLLNKKSVETGSGELYFIMVFGEDEESDMPLKIETYIEEME